MYYNRIVLLIIPAFALGVSVIKYKCINLNMQIPYVTKRTICSIKITDANPETVSVKLRKKAHYQGLKSKDFQEFRVQ